MEIFNGEKSTDARSRNQMNKEVRDQSAGLIGKTFKNR